MSPVSQCFRDDECSRVDLDGVGVSDLNRGCTDVVEIDTTSPLVVVTNGSTLVGLNLSISKHCTCKHRDVNG